jgi:ataxia telangiectasia mutated family protein
MLPRDAYALLVQTRKKSGPDKVALIEAFKIIRKKFKPVLRHFFTEQHKLPLVWFETRLNYTRSVATTSIIGHVLGLGDRHISNILLDNVSGEVVHIDLGIAFEQVSALSFEVSHSR